MSNWPLPPGQACPDIRYLTFETPGRLNFLCCGFLDKAGVSVDAVDMDYPFYVLVYVLRGRGRYVDAAGKNYDLEAGMAFQRVPGRRHSVYIDPASSWLEGAVGLVNAEAGGPEPAAELWPWRRPGGGQLTLDALRTLDVIDINRPVLTPGVRPELTLRFRDLLERCKHASKSELPGLQLPLCELLRAVAQADRGEGGGPSEPVAAARAVLDATLSSRKGLPELLAKIPLSYSRLRARFKSEQGLSLEAYRVRRRVEAACGLLASGEMTPAQAAAALGYNDYFAFSRQFKRGVGCAPREFSRSLAAPRRSGP